MQCFGDVTWSRVRAQYCAMLVKCFMMKGSECVRNCQSTVKIKLWCIVVTLLHGAELESTLTAKFGYCVDLKDGLLNNNFCTVKFLE